MAAGPLTGPGERDVVDIKVLAFAWARDALGADKTDVDLPEGATVEDLLRRLGEAHPRLAGRAGGLTVAVNEEFAGSDRVLRAGDEVALIPPISGGGRV